MHIIILIYKISNFPIVNIFEVTYHIYEDIYLKKITTVYPSTINQHPNKSN